MKKIFILFLVVLGIPSFTFSQEQVDTNAVVNAWLDSLDRELDSLFIVLKHERDSIKSVKVNYAKEMQEVTKVLPRFKIYPTENIHILLKLDTQSGKVWMVQYSMGDTESAEIPIKYLPIINEDEGWKGRFELYPTKNMYNFIMVDDDNGDTYQVQWSTTSSYRFIHRITND